MFKTKVEEHDTMSKMIHAHTEKVFGSVTAVVLRPLPGRGLDDVVDADDHLGRLGAADQHLALDLERLGDAQLVHLSDVSALHVQPRRLLAGRVRGAHAGHQVRAVVARVVGDVGGQHAQRTGKRLKCNKT